MALSRLVVKFRDLPDLPYLPDSQPGRYFLQRHIPEWKTFPDIFPVMTIKSLFTSLKPGKIRHWMNKAIKSDPGYQPTDLLSYFAIDCEPGTGTDKLLRRLSQCKEVELAYRETDGYAPSANSYKEIICSVQEYLGPAPKGIDAVHAWRIPGGDGAGKVRFIDIEKGWMLNHEALRVNIFPETGINRHAYAEHGAGILGIVTMQPNETGAVGVTPKAKGSVISQYRPDGSLNTADAIMTAIDRLRFGDVLLLEAQVLDPAGGENLLPVEIQEAVHRVTRLATALGIIVVEAGGNGNIYGNMGTDLDQFNLDGKKILNPRSTDFKDSGAILVAASSARIPHERMWFSNYGQRMNCFAWGEFIMTAGNHPGVSGCAINTYTENFGGSSGAAAIIAGAAIAVQSILEANHRPRLSSLEMRKILSDDSSGTSSANGRETDKIGVMPDLKRIIKHVADIRTVVKTRRKRLVES